MPVNRMKLKWQRWSITIAVLFAVGLLRLEMDFSTVRAKGQSAGKARDELVQNGGFEEPGSPLPRGWSRDLKQTGKKGSVTVEGSKVHAGSAAVMLQPNDKNAEDQPLAISQIIPAGSYRGKKVVFSGYLAADGGATAGLILLSIVGGRPGNLAMVQARSPEWSFQSKEYEVPDDGNVQLVIACMANGKSGTAWFDDISMALGGAPQAGGGPSVPAQAAPSSVDRSPMKAQVEVDAQRIIRQIPSTLFGTNIEWRWNANYLWQESQRRVDPEIVRLTRDLGITLIRYPGGIYSDYYHWKDGIGPLDRRKEVKHEAGSDDHSRPYFGTDEALAFAKEIGAELLITVNAGTGTAEEAAEWVRYVNGKDLRVRYWEVGNELYIRDGPTSKPITMDPTKYAAKFLEFAKAMRVADPRVKIGAIGGENYGRYAVVAYPDWDKTLLTHAGDQMDFLSVHNSYAPVLATDQDLDVRAVYRTMLGAPVLQKRNLQTLAEQIVQYAPAHSAQMFIAVTEWGPFFQLDFKGRYVDHPKTLGSALFAASVMKTLMESPKAEIANFWFLNDLSVLGWIGSRSTKFPPQPEWAATARYYAFQLYRHHFGTQLVQSNASSPTFDSQSAGWIDGVKGVPYLDVISSLSSDRNQLYLIAINKNFDSAIDSTLSLKGFLPNAQAKAWTLTGTSIDANTGTIIIRIPGYTFGEQAQDSQNPRFSKGRAEEITFLPSEVHGAGANFSYSFPPRSVTSIMLTRKK